jgi:hypothetical protein
MPRSTKSLRALAVVLFVAAGVFLGNVISGRLAAQVTHPNHKCTWIVCADVWSSSGCPTGVRCNPHTTAQFQKCYPMMYPGCTEDPGVFGSINCQGKCAAFPNPNCSYTLNFCG